MRVSDSASRLAIGTAQLGLPYGVSNTKGQVGRDEAFRILYAAATADIDTVDTARAYGTSEQVLGEAFARAGAGHFRVVTKISSLKGCAADVAPQLEASLRALGKGVVPDVLLHDESDLAGADGAAVWRELQDARARGVVGKLGVSSYDPARLLELVERFELELVQVPFNLLDRRFFSPELCAAYGRRKVEVHARSVFLQGLFFLKAETLPENLEFARPTVERLQELGLNLPAASLALALGNERISKVVVGVTSSAELAEILSWPVAPLQPELDAELAGLWKLTSGRVLDPSLWR